MLLEIIESSDIWILSQIEELSETPPVSLQGCCSQTLTSSQPR